MLSFVSIDIALLNNPRKPTEISRNQEKSRETRSWNLKRRRKKIKQRGRKEEKGRRNELK
jgi:hypothetical protein